LPLVRPALLGQNQLSSRSDLDGRFRPQDGRFRPQIGTSLTRRNFILFLKPVHGPWNSALDRNVVFKAALIAMQAVSTLHDLRRDFAE
jgi:hypothetical protein